MFDESYLIDQIKTATGYTNVDYSDDYAIDLPRTDLTNPIIRVGHILIRTQHPENLFADGYNELENPELLVTEIKIYCKRVDLAIVRTNVKNAYTGYSPFANDSNYSSLIFLESEVIAIANNNIFWSEKVGLVMPRLS